MEHEIKERKDTCLCQIDWIFIFLRLIFYFIVISFIYVFPVQAAVIDLVSVNVSNQKRIM